MATKRPTNLSELTDMANRERPWMAHVDAERREKAEVCDAIAAALDRRPKPTALWVHKLDQDGLESLIDQHGDGLRAIHFWKCPLVPDLTPLEHATGLELVAWYWNQRAERLWNFARTPRLRGLEVTDFSRLRDLRDLRRAQSLRELEFGNAVWSKAVFRSLDPLAGLAVLQRLRFNAKAIEDGRIEPLASLTALRVVDFPPHQFTTEQVAWLRARLPDGVSGRSLGPVMELAVAPTELPRELQDKAFLVGKGKPMLDAVRNRSRIERHVREFASLVETYRADPRLREPIPAPRRRAR